MHEGSIQSETNKSRRSNGETLTNSSSCITSRIQNISSFSHLGIKFSHFGNTSGIVTDRSIAIDSEANGKIGKHAQGSQSHTVVAKSGVREVDHKTEDDNGDDGGKIAQSKSINDIGGGSSLACNGKFLNVVVRVTSHNFSHIADDETSDQTNSNASEDISEDLGVRNVIIGDEDEGIGE